MKKETGGFMSFMEEKFLPVHSVPHGGHVRAVPGHRHRPVPPVQ